MILEGKIPNAFEKFSAEDVFMQDNDYPPRAGKDVCRQFEQDSLKNPGFIICFTRNFLLLLPCVNF
jgi:hypothetical protein